MNNVGLSGGPPEFKAFTEIAIIAHLADNLFASVLPEGLTPAQFGVLNHLLRLETQETISAIATALQVSQPTMSSTIKKLEQKGFTRRLADNSDARAKRVCVTNMGRRVRNHSVANIETLREELAGGFDDIDWDALLPSLTKLRLMLDRLRNSQE